VSMNNQGDDVRAIEAIINQQFESLNWTPDDPADWDTFAQDFNPIARLFPSARPAKHQTVDEFIKRMRALAQTSLRSFKQTPLGREILVFGNIAVALGACENLENGSKVTRNVEAFLLIKDEGDWRIVAQAWDVESDAKPIPPLLAVTG